MKLKFKVFQSIPEVLTYVLLIFVLFLNIVGLFISAGNASKAKTLAAQNQKFASDSQAQTVVARKQNIDRQNEIKGYIKCVLLLRYDNPNLGTNSPRADVEAALDKCALSTAGGDQ